MGTVLGSLVNETEEKSYDVKREEISFDQYLEEVRENPNLLRTSHQLIYDMILSDGVKTVKGKKKYTFFEDPHQKGKDAIFGIDQTIEETVGFFSNASKFLGADKRVLLFKGPVGSAKSSLTRLLKNGLERYTRTKEGKLYSYYWDVGEVDSEKKEKVRHIFGLTNKLENKFHSPMNENPIKLLPEKLMKKFIKDLDAGENDRFNHHEIYVNPRMCPADKKIYDELVSLYDGNWQEVLSKHVVVKRLVLDEQQRVGIGSFQPKDEKNQDSTELNGDINYSKISIFGSDSDPRAFNFDGEFNIANRGMIEFVEMLKLEVAFLYDLLGASQEQMIKPKKFTQTPIDEVIIGHTNEPEYNKLEKNQFMEALRNRTIKIEVPYILSLDNETKIYEKMFRKYSKRLHVAPHTFTAGALYAVLTRLTEPKNQELTMVDKMNIYNGKHIPKNMGESEIEDLRKEGQAGEEKEGSFGVSPRTIQDELGNAMIEGEEKGYVSPTMVLNKLERNIEENPLSRSDQAMKDKFTRALTQTRNLITQKITEDVLNCSVINESQIEAMYNNYIEQITAYKENRKIKNNYSGQMDEVDEKFMRDIEEQIEVPENMKDEFRSSVLLSLGIRSRKNKNVDYKSDDKLYKALKRKSVLDNKNAIHFKTAVTDLETSDNKKMVDSIKDQLIEKYHYNEQSAVEAINLVASILNKSSSNLETLDLNFL